MLLTPVRNMAVAGIPMICTTAQVGSAWLSSAQILLLSSLVEHIGMLACRQVLLLQQTSQEMMASIIYFLPYNRPSKAARKEQWRELGRCTHKDGHSSHVAPALEHVVDDLGGHIAPSFAIVQLVRVLRHTVQSLTLQAHIFWFSLSLLRCSWGSVDCGGKVGAQPAPIGDQGPRNHCITASSVLELSIPSSWARGPVLQMACAKLGSSWTHPWQGGRLNAKNAGEVDPTILGMSQCSPQCGQHVVCSCLSGSVEGRILLSPSTCQ